MGICVTFVSHDDYLVCWEQTVIILGSNKRKCLRQKEEKLDVQLLIARWMKFVWGKGNYFRTCVYIHHLPFLQFLQRKHFCHLQHFCSTNCTQKEDIYECYSIKFSRQNFVSNSFQIYKKVLFFFSSQPNALLV